MPRDGTARPESKSVESSRLACKRNALTLCCSRFDLLGDQIEEVKNC